MKIPQNTDERITKIINKQLDFKLGQFTHEEHDVVFRKINNSKALDLDVIPPEVWKTRKFYDILHQYYNAVHNQDKKGRFKKGFILLFYRTCDIEIAKNYRGINLTFKTAKIYNALFLYRIEPETEKIWGKTQNGFRRNRST